MAIHWLALEILSPSRLDFAQGVGTYIARGTLIDLRVRRCPASSSNDHVANVVYRNTIDDTATSLMRLQQSRAAVEGISVPHRLSVPGHNPQTFKQ